MITTLVFMTVALGAPQAAQPRPAAPAQSRPPAPTWTYDPQGRRDPFISLRNRTPVGPTTQNRPPGLPGVAIGELVIRGIIRNGNEFIAMAQSVDGRSFQLRRGSRVFDGVVKQIAIDAVIFTQEVNDPLSLVKQREVRKTMRTGDREEEL